MRGLLEAMHDYPDEALGVSVLLLVIVWLLTGMVETIVKETRENGGDDRGEA